MDESLAGPLIGLVMSPMTLLLLYATIQGAASEPVDRFGMTGIRIKATQRSDAAWLAGHRAAFPVAKKALLAVLAVDAVRVALLFVWPGWWLGFVPVIALLLATVPVMRAATKAANTAP